MKRFIEFRESERKKTVENFINCYTSNSFDDFISIVKATGILINPYDGKFRDEKKIEELGKFLNQNATKCELEKWSLIKEQASVINDLFCEMYKSETFVSTKEMNPEYEVYGFLIVLEQMLFYLRNIAKSKSYLNDELNYKVDFDFAYEVNGYENENRKAIDIFERISYTADSVLTYLMFYKYKGKFDNYDIETVVPHEEVYKAYNHLKSNDIHDVINDLFEKWKFCDCNISKNETNIDIDILEKDFIKEMTIAKNRFEIRKQNLQLEIALFSNKLEQKVNKYTVQLPPTEYLSIDEAEACELIKEYLFISDFNYSCLVNNDGEIKVKLSELIRAYSILKETSKEFIENRDLDTESVHSICRFIDEDNLKKLLTLKGIDSNNVENVIKSLTYSKYKDIYDCPLIKYRNGYILIPSILECTDISMVILSNVSQFNFEGELFEDKIIEELRKQGINATKITYKESGKEFQCDVIFSLGKDLYICECKAWGECKNVRSFYEQTKKKINTYEQIQRISNQYKKNVSNIVKCLGLSEEYKPRHIYNIIILTTMQGKNERISNTYFIDCSALNKFIKREKPTVNLPYNGKMLRYTFPNYNHLDGSITTNKLIKFLENPYQIDLENRAIEEQVRTAPIGKYNLKYCSYERKWPNQIDLNENLEKYLDIISKTYNLK